MGTKVGRVALFGIPLQQTWSYGNTGDFAPTYYLQTDAPLYYYSFTDAFIAMAYRSLTPEEQARFDPMITGFNPADMYAADHIQRVLQTFPGVFSGIGEFTIHKEFVSVEGRRRDGEPRRTPRSTGSSTSRARSGSSCSCTTTSTCRSPSRARTPTRSPQLARLFRRHPKTTIIWAHCGLGRIVHPVKDQLAIVERALVEPRAAPTSPSTSRGTRWRSTSSRRRRRSQATADLINRHPDRFLFGTDEVAPTDQAKLPEGLRHVRAALRRS